MISWKITALLLLALAAVSWGLYAQISHTSEIRQRLEQHQRALENVAPSSKHRQREARRCLISA